MLRVAVPNKGALSESASEILSEAGYRRREPAEASAYFESVGLHGSFWGLPED